MNCPKGALTIPIASAVANYEYIYIYDCKRLRRARTPHQLIARRGGEEVELV